MLKQIHIFAQIDWTLLEIEIDIKIYKQHNFCEVEQYENNEV